MIEPTDTAKDATSPPGGDSRASDSGHRLDVIAAAVLGLAAVLVAWAAYQSSLWGGVQDGLLIESVNTTTQATDLFQQADSIRSLDQVLFVELFTSGACESDGDDLVCDQIFANMSPDGVDGVNRWFDNDEVAPFDETYDNALYTEGDALLEEANDLFDSADAANATGDDYSLAVTLLTVTLFFAGLSVTINGPRTRIVMLVAGLAFLLGGTVFLTTLPWA